MATDHGNLLTGLFWFGEFFLKQLFQYLSYNIIKCVLKMT